MSISIDLRMLAKKIETSSDELLANASDKGPEVLDKVASAIAAASSLLEEVAGDMESNSDGITVEHLDELAALASELDKSDNPLLKKKASVLDELLLSIGSSKQAYSRKTTEDEINRLRDEKRKQSLKDCYETPRETHSDMHDAKNQAKAVEQQVKRYMPLEAPLQTRYPPDRPGGQMTRITDHVYQDIETGIIYDFKNGYKTQKGNEIPGGAVENQTRDLGDWNNSNSALFSTRESIMGSFANKKHNITKQAQDSGSNDINTIIKTVSELYPEDLDKTMDFLYDNGATTSQVADALAESGAVTNDELDAKRVNQFKPTPLTENEKQNEKANLEKLLFSFRGCGDLAKKLSCDYIWEAYGNKSINADDVDKYVNQYNLPFYELVEEKQKESLPPEAIQEKEKQTRPEIAIASFTELKNVLAQDISFEDEDDNTEVVSKDSTDELQRIRGLKDRFYKLQDVRSNPNLTTPKEDLEGWLKAYHDVQEEMEIDNDFQDYLSELDKTGEFKKLYQNNQNLSLNKDAYSKSKVGYIINGINERGFVSPWDYDIEAPNGGKMWWQVADTNLNPEKDETAEKILEDITDPSSWENYYKRNGLDKTVPYEKFAQDVEEVSNSLNKFLPSIEDRINNLLKTPRLPKSIENMLGSEKDVLFDKLKDHSILDEDVVKFYNSLPKEERTSVLTPSDVIQARLALPILHQVEKIDLLKNSIRIALYHKTVNGLLNRMGYPVRYDESQDMSTKEYIQKIRNILTNSTR